MSWAEDNNIDCWDIEDCLDLEEMWRNGQHQDREGKIWELKDMTTFHLRNTIKYFSTLDTTPLKKELKSRNY